MEDSEADVLLAMTLAEIIPDVDGLGVACGNSTPFRVLVLRNWMDRGSTY